MSQDPKGLVDVWAEDGVRFKPGSSPTIGKQAIAAESEKFHAQYPEFKVLKYAPDLKNVQIAIVDGRAIEVASADATYEMSGKDSPVSIKDKSMRLLRRQSDGSWKFALVGLKELRKCFFAALLFAGIPFDENYFNFAYSALASLRMGMSGSAFFQSVRKS